MASKGLNVSLAAQDVSMPAHTNFQHLMLIDGSSASAESRYLYATGSLVFKAKSRAEEYFDRWLQPGRHYIPVDEGLENLASAIEWAHANPKEAAAIGAAARGLAASRLRPRHALCWLRALLGELARLQQYKVRLASGATRIC